MIPVIISPTRSWYSSNIMSRSASRIRWRITCLAVCAAIRPKSVGVTSRRRDLVLVLGKPLEVDLGLLGLAQLARLGVDRALLLDRLVDQLLLELRRQDQLEHAEVGRAAIHVDARVLGRAGRLLVGGEQRVLERQHQLLRRDALLASRGSGRPRRSPCSLAPPVLESSARARRRRLRDQVRAADALVRDRDRAPVGRRARRPLSSAPISSPLKSLRPSIASRVRTRTRRPR